MIRLRAVRTLLFEDVAELPSLAPEETELTVLAKARKRAALMAAFDWLAIIALFVLRSPTTDFLIPAATEQGVFTLGVLAVASHAGYKLGQMQKFSAVAGALELLPETDDQATE